ncbi:hypothetical protein [Cerasicoccus fimbriatus]|uniref:hypothetical protein n=1 Tax=Cerasicoccus fimbriatus TaxID=3014554 RepID=UPI0022B3D3E5|nr:hypothetical protein [Cerasicoccus sp. TK19100]
MQVISKRKKHYPVNADLHSYLSQYGREIDLPILYSGLTSPYESFPLLDKDGEDTLWQTFIYEPTIFREINEALTRIYALLQIAGNESVEHLRVDRVDFCSFGNSQPFRIRIINQYNDNYDYFYVKKADASRIYGLELEEMLSPSSINYLVHQDTLIEEHIVGVPGDQFIREYMNRDSLNRVRVAKEFIKFNERCFARLLGDMRSYNYVVGITPDFDNEQYRVRPIDFDQQSYEGRHKIYLPQFFKDNLPVVQLCTGLLNYETIQQYQIEERALMARRANTIPYRLNNLRVVMGEDTISPHEKLEQLKRELSDYHHYKGFLDCSTMGDLVFRHIDYLLFEQDLG